MCITKEENLPQLQMETEPLQQMESAYRASTSGLFGIEELLSRMSAEERQAYYEDIINRRRVNTDQN